MSEPPELEHWAAALNNGMSAEMFSAWNRGVCDGLEIAARMGEEGLLPNLDQAGQAYAMVQGLTQAVRQAQLRVQLDGVVP